MVDLEEAPLRDSGIPSGRPEGGQQRSRLPALRPFQPARRGCVRAEGKPIPQPKYALFWEAHAKKVKDDHERTIVTIRPL